MKVYQPANIGQDGSPYWSFEVWRSRENCQEDNPDQEIIEYDESDIEEPTFVD